MDLNTISLPLLGRQGQQKKKNKRKIKRTKEKEEEEEEGAQGNDAHKELSEQPLHSVSHVDALQDKQV